MAKSPPSAGQDSADYTRRKNRFQRMLTIYGRKAVLEALQDSNINVSRVHLANSNKPANIIQQITALAEQRSVEISYKDKTALSRISKNARQDQGAAADLLLQKMRTLEDFTQSKPVDNARYLVLDRIHNPQNLGMIIRSAAAGSIDAVFIPEQECAAISPLVIKASAGAVFKCPIIRAITTEQCIAALRQQQVTISVLSGTGEQSLWQLYRDADAKPASRAFILGNESEGVAPAIRAQADEQLCIPMQNGIESLNVAVAAGLIAFLPPAGPMPRG